MSNTEAPKFQVRCTRPMYVAGQPVAVDDVVSVTWADALVIVGAKRGELVKPTDASDIKKANDAHNLQVHHDARRFASMTGRLQAFFNS